MAFLAARRQQGHGTVFKIGRKDRHGRQKRIEYTGQYLRASRTGLVSLRAQTRVAGVNATANTRRGVRLSTRVAKNTQVAMQNGRFVLRGRYGSDAAKFNVSKSGVTVSTRTPSGTLNWIKPGRSSFKLAGVQMRGYKAVWLQLAYLLVMAVVVVLQVLLRGVAALVSGLYRAAVTAVVRARLWRGRVAQERLLAALDPTDARALAKARLGDRLGPRLSAQVPASCTEHLGTLGYALICLGRGDVQGAGVRHDLDSEGKAEMRGLLRAIAPAVSAFRDAIPAPDDAEFPLVALGLALHAADRLDGQLTGDAREQTLLLLDDACLAAGPKTVLQEAMIDALGACWEARLVLAGEC